MKRLSLTLFAAAAAGALPAATPAQAAPAFESITYGAGACFGRCPIYRVTVHADGRGTFEGINFTAVTGTREFRVTPMQYQAFVAHLAPLRPARGSLDYRGSGRCRELITDAPSADVTWQPRRGPAQTLHYYYGCDPRRHRLMQQRLGTAPDLLPIQAFIGSPR